MPCYDSRNDASYQVDEARQQWMHNSPVAEMLCRTLRKAERSGLELDRFCDTSTLVWYEAHKKRDRERKLDVDRASKNEIISAEKAVADVTKKLQRLKEGK